MERGSDPAVWVFEVTGESTRAPLVLLHGSNGSELDLLPIAGRLSPGASRLGVRGRVPMDPGFAFFRRHPDRRVDEADISSRVSALAALIGELTDRGPFVRPPVVVGFSNGAIMAAALVATSPQLLAGAILFRPLSPFSADSSYCPTTLPVLIIDGATDHRRSPADGARLATRLSGAGAVVTHRVLPVGHALSAEDEQVARAWLASSEDPDPGPHA